MNNVGVTCITTEEYKKIIENSIKAKQEIEKLEKEKKELEIFVKMYFDEFYNSNKYNIDGLDLNSENYKNSYEFEYLRNKMLRDGIEDFSLIEQLIVKLKEKYDENNKAKEKEEGEDK